jgi:hypothetical protein
MATASRHVSSLRSCLRVFLLVHCLTEGFLIVVARVQAITDYLSAEGPAESRRGLKALDYLVDAFVRVDAVERLAVVDADEAAAAVIRRTLQQCRDLAVSFIATVLAEPSMFAGAGYVRACMCVRVCVYVCTSVRV